MPLYTPFAGGERTITQGIGDADDSHGYDGDNGPFNDHFHYSLDFGAPTGTEVVAVGKGTIHHLYNKWGTAAATGEDHDLGNFITIKLDTGEYVTTSHAPAGAFQGYAVGEKVSPGQVLHTVGTTGFIVGAHIHMQFGTALNTDPSWKVTQNGVLKYTIADSRESSNASNVDFHYDTSGTVQSSFYGDHYGHIYQHLTSDPVRIYAVKEKGGIVYDGDAAAVYGTNSSGSYPGTDTLSIGNNGWMDGKTGADNYIYRVGHGSVVINDSGLALEPDFHDKLLIKPGGLLAGSTIAEGIIFTKTDGGNDLQLSFDLGQSVDAGTVTINDFFQEDNRIEYLGLYDDAGENIVSSLNLKSYWIAQVYGAGGNPEDFEYGGGSGGTTQPDQSKIHFASATAEVQEAGTTTFRMPIEIPSDLNNVTINWLIEPVGTNPVDRHDFQEGGDLPYTGSVLFNKNMLPLDDDVKIRIVDDGVVEQNETFKITLTSTSAGAIDPNHNTAIVTITDAEVTSGGGSGSGGGSSGGGSGSTGTTPPDDALAVYVDAFVQDWNDWSWSTTKDAANTEPVQGGTASLEVAYTDNWSGLYLHTDTALDASSVDTLNFAVHGGTVGGQELYASVYGTSDQELGQVAVNDYVPGGTIAAGQWYDVAIPLSAFNASGEDISGVVIMSATPTTVYYDNIYFGLSDDQGTVALIEGTNGADALTVDANSTVKAYDGNDVISAADLGVLASSEVDGGGWYDTLVLGGSNQLLDFSQLDLLNLEQVNLTGSNNTVTVSYEDIVRMGGTLQLDQVWDEGTITVVQGGSTGYTQTVDSGRDRYDFTGPDEATLFVDEGVDILLA